MEINNPKLISRLGNPGICEAIEIEYRKRINYYCNLISQFNNNKELRVTKMKLWLDDGTFNMSKFSPSKFREDNVTDRLSILRYKEYLKATLIDYEEWFGDYPETDQILRVLPEGYK